MNYFQLLKRLYNLYDHNAGKTVGSNSIIRQVRRAIPFQECKIIKIQTLGVITNQFEVSGLYNPSSDENGEKCITIEVAFPAFKSQFIFNENDLSRDHWSQFCIDFVTILGHEYVHLNQFRRRKFKVNSEYKSSNRCTNIRENQIYYGDSDEIDAYAFSAASQLIIEWLPKNKPLTFRKNNIYRIYTKYFKKDDPVVLKFVKLTEKHFKRLEKQYYDTRFE